MNHVCKAGINPRDRLLCFRQRTARVHNKILRWIFAEDCRPSAGLSKMQVIFRDNHRYVESLGRLPFLGKIYAKAVTISPVVRSFSPSGKGTAQLGGLCHCTNSAPSWPRRTIPRKIPTEWPLYSEMAASSLTSSCFSHGWSCPRTILASDSLRQFSLRSACRE